MHKAVIPSPVRDALLFYAEKGERFSVPDIHCLAVDKFYGDATRITKNLVRGIVDRYAISDGRKWRWLDETRTKPERKNGCIAEFQPRSETKPERNSIQKVQYMDLSISRTRGSRVRPGDLAPPIAEALAVSITRERMENWLPLVQGGAPAPDLDAIDDWPAFVADRVSDLSGFWGATQCAFFMALVWPKDICDIGTVEKYADMIRNSLDPEEMRPFCVALTGYAVEAEQIDRKFLIAPKSFIFDRWHDFRVGARRLRKDAENSQRDLNERLAALAGEKQTILRAERRKGCGNQLWRFKEDLAGAWFAVAASMPPEKAPIVERAAAVLADLRGKRLTLPLIGETCMLAIDALAQIDPECPHKGPNDRPARMEWARNGERYGLPGPDVGFVPNAPPPPETPSQVAIRELQKYSKIPELAKLADDIAAGRNFDLDEPARVWCRLPGCGVDPDESFLGFIEHFPSVWEVWRAT